MMLRKLAFLVVFMAVLTAPPAMAEEKKPPIIIHTGKTKYIINSDSEKMREIFLRADRIKIVRKKKDRDDWREDYYRNYYRHHRNIRDHEDDPDKVPYYSGYGAGYLISRDRD